MKATRRRVVVVGHGMVGARFVEELLDRAPAGQDVTVLGVEEYEPYNRVLLSEVVAGRTDIASIMLPVPAAAGTRQVGGGSLEGRGGPCVGGGGPCVGEGGPFLGEDVPCVGEGVPFLGRGVPCVGDGVPCVGEGGPCVGGGDARAPSTLTALRGCGATQLDRARRTVVDSHGRHHRYDVLVLATGAAARVPSLAGLSVPPSVPGSPPSVPGSPPSVPGSPPSVPGPTPEPSADPALPAGVHALRSLDDAREIVAAGANAHRAVVLGGGVLGLEAACGLARRGLCVTVVHAGPHLMDRQLEAAAAEAVTHGLAELGVAQRTDAVAVEVVHGARGLVGLRLDRSSAAPDGELVPADLLVLAVGTAPRTDLAARAGLAVERGILVDEGGGTADPSVFALGDCAEPPEGGSGLLAQGWAQARTLARRLTEGGPPGAPAGPLAPRQPADRPALAPGPATDVVRVKAHGLDVVTMGRCGSRRAPGGRTVRLSDPEAGRHVEVVVEGGVVVGATCVGAGAVAADLVTAYTRATPAPADPAQLLLPRVRGAAAGGSAEASPTLMPDRATVCRCNGVTKGDLVAAWRSGARSTEEIATATRATTGCGGCSEAVCGLVEWLHRSDPPAPSAQDASTGHAARVRGSFVP